MRHTRYQGAIIQDDKILLIRHTEHASGRSFWVIHGGGREAGETEMACVAREMWEETNLVVQVERLLVEMALFLSTTPHTKLAEMHEAFVCERPDGRLCGLVEVSIHTSAPGCETDHIGYLEAWYVDSDVRNQGVGRALAERAEAWARAESCVEMASDTTPDYPLSPAAHAALGYAEVERYFRKELSQ